jgi:hypothetical protein
MPESASGVLVRAARPLHHPVKGHMVHHDDPGHLGLPSSCSALLVRTRRFSCRGPSATVERAAMSHVWRVSTNPKSESAMAGGTYRHCIIDIAEDQEARGRFTARRVRGPIRIGARVGVDRWRRSNGDVTMAMVAARLTFMWTATPTQIPGPIPPPIGASSWVDAAASRRLTRRTGALSSRFGSFRRADPPRATSEPRGGRRCRGDLQVPPPTPGGGLPPRRAPVSR